MATVNVSAPARTDWIFSNPWLWSGIGLSSCGVALFVQLTSEDLVRLVFIFLGLLGAGAGLALRLQSSRISMRWPVQLHRSPGRARC